MIIGRALSLTIKTLNSWTSLKKPESSYLQPTSSNGPDLLPNVVTRHLLQGHTVTVIEQKYARKVQRYPP